MAFVPFLLLIRSPVRVLMAVFLCSGPFRVTLAIWSVSGCTLVLSRSWTFGGTARDSKTLARAQGNWWPHSLASTSLDRSAHMWGLAACLQGFCGKGEWRPWETSSEKRTMPLSPFRSWASPLVLGEVFARGLPSFRVCSFESSK